jgi:hypothetical protein
VKKISTLFWGTSGICVYSITFIKSHIPSSPQNNLYILLICWKFFNKNCRNNRNISIFTSINYHSVFIRPFLFFQHNQQYDTLLPILPCAHKLQAGIAYSILEVAIYTFKYLIMVYPACMIYDSCSQTEY